MGGLSPSRLRVVLRRCYQRINATCVVMVVPRNIFGRRQRIGFRDGFGIFSQADETHSAFVPDALQTRTIELERSIPVVQSIGMAIQLLQGLGPAPMGVAKKLARLDPLRIPLDERTEHAHRFGKPSEGFVRPLANAEVMSEVEVTAAQLDRKQW